MGSPYLGAAPLVLSCHLPRPECSARSSTPLGETKAQNGDVERPGTEGSSELARRFSAELALLERLFGAQEVASKLPRLEEIFDYAEARWREYAARLQGGRVKYLMIAEAPPWSSGGRPEYALDPDSRPRLIMSALRPAFRLGLVGSGVALTQLAQRGFLLVDCAPFAMAYSGKRNRVAYGNLIRLLVSSFLQDKLNSSGLSFADDLRIAFAFKMPAQAVLRTAECLTIGGRQYPLSSDMIAVNEANNPDSRRLRVLFGLPQHLH